jgi:hypothetical protein
MIQQNKTKLIVKDHQTLSQAFEKLLLKKKESISS